MAHEKLKSSPVYKKIITLFPTIVFGGDESHSFSHISQGLMKSPVVSEDIESFFMLMQLFIFYMEKILQKLRNTF